jgi:hypothetical protein
MTRNRFTSFTGEIRLKFVPSRARYYIKCPYFLYLSNIKNIYIPYPRIASLKGNFFESVVLDRFSGETGYEIGKAKQVTDLLEADGLYTLNKRVNIEFYAEGNVGFRVGILKPDLILSEMTSGKIRITVMEIKNSDCLMPYHLLQAYVYKLTLERLLSQATPIPVQIGVRMIHLEEGFHSRVVCEADFGIFRERLAGMTIDSLVKSFVNQESEIVLQSALQRIASLQPDLAECATCPGLRKCEHGSSAARY